MCSISTTDRHSDSKCSSSVVIFDLMPTRWICTSVCSSSATDHDSDSKCSSSVVVFDLLPTRWPVCVQSVRLIMIVMISVQAVLLYLIYYPPGGH